MESRQNISGECTISGKQLSLRLRKNGVYLDEGNTTFVDVEKPDELINLAAITVADATVPYLNAVIKPHSEPTAAITMARRIIAESPEADINVLWSHILIGAIYYQQGRTNLAIDEFKKVIGISDHFWNPNNTIVATAHNNMGLALLDQRNNQDAISHFTT